jgi:large subunit ribosomal protein L22
LTGSTDTLTVRAEARWTRFSARKARVVLDHIRGRSVPEARTILAFTPRAAASEIDKLLRSAVANAEANHGLDGDELIVVAAFANDGPTLKRWRARARGRVNRIRKRTCHITVELAQDPRLEHRPRRKAAKPAAEKAPRAEAVEEVEEVEEVQEVEEVEAAEDEVASEGEVATPDPAEEATGDEEQEDVEKGEDEKGATV